MEEREEAAAAAAAIEDAPIARIRCVLQSGRACLITCMSTNEYDVRVK